MEDGGEKIAPVKLDKAEVNRAVAAQREVPGESKETQSTANYVKTINSVKQASTQLSDLLRDGVPEIQYRIANILPAGGTLMIASPPKSGKTFLAMEVTRAISAGEQFLGVHPTTQGSVLYIDEENGTVTLHNRLARLFKGEEDAAERVRLVVKSGLYLDDPDAPVILRELVDEWKPDVIIFDSVVRFMQGEENSASDVRRVYEAIKDLEELGVSIIFLHHTAKGRNGSKADAVRGSGDWRAMVQVLMWMEKTRHGFKAGIADHRHLPTDFMEDVVLSLTDIDGKLSLRQEGTAKRQKLNKELAADAYRDWLTQNPQIETWLTKTAQDAVLKSGHSRTAFYDGQALLEKEEAIRNIDNRAGQWQRVPGMFPVEQKVSE